MSHTITANDVPELRADMIADAERRSHSPVMRDWAASLKASYQYWVNQTVRDTAVQMAEHLLPLTIQAEDAPTEYGLLVWEGTVNGLAGFTWRIFGNKLLLAGLYPKHEVIARRAENLREAGLKEAVPHLLEQTLSALCSDMDQPIPLGVELTEINIYLMTMPENEMDQTVATFLPTMAMSLWLLMSQEIAVSEMVRPSRHGLKRLARLDPAFLTQTRYITLRRKANVDYEKPEGAESGIHYSVRFPVREHKRLIPDKDNPGSYRTIRVRAHWKGPEGAPMLDPDRLVTRLVK